MRIAVGKISLMAVSQIFPHGFHSFFARILRFPLRKVAQCPAIEFRGGAHRLIPIGLQSQLQLLVQVVAQGRIVFLCSVLTQNPLQGRFLEL